MSQRKMAMDEFTDINEKWAPSSVCFPVPGPSVESAEQHCWSLLPELLQCGIHFACCRLTEMRSQRQKLSRQVRDREEELDDVRHKMENIRQELRKADKSKREVWGIPWNSNGQMLHTSVVHHSKFYPRQPLSFILRASWNPPNNAFCLHCLYN